jgi:hypothetical protein
VTPAALDRLLATIRQVYGLERENAALATVRFTFYPKGDVEMVAGLLAPTPGLCIDVGPMREERIVVFAVGTGANVDEAFDALWGRVQQKVSEERDKAEKAARAAGLTPYSVEVKF